MTQLFGESKEQKTKKTTKENPLKDFEKLQMDSDMLMEAAGSNMTA